jgi:hypothetical protein
VPWQIATILKERDFLEHILKVQISRILIIIIGVLYVEFNQIVYIYIPQHLGKGWGYFYF